MERAGSVDVAETSVFRTSSFRVIFVLVQQNLLFEQSGEWRCQSVGSSIPETSLVGLSCDDREAGRVRDGSGDRKITTSTEFYCAVLQNLNGSGRWEDGQFYGV